MTLISLRLNAVFLVFPRKNMIKKQELLFIFRYDADSSTKDQRKSFCVNSNGDRALLLLLPWLLARKVALLNNVRNVSALIFYKGRSLKKQSKLTVAAYFSFQVPLFYIMK